MQTANFDINKVGSKDFCLWLHERVAAQYISYCSALRWVFHLAFISQKRNREKKAENKHCDFFSQRFINFLKVFFCCVEFLSFFSNARVKSFYLLKFLFFRFFFHLLLIQVFENSKHFFLILKHLNWQDYFSSYSSRSNFLSSSKAKVLLYLPNLNFGKCINSRLSTMGGCLDLEMIKSLHLRMPIDPKCTLFW